MVCFFFRRPLCLEALRPAAETGVLAHPQTTTPKPPASGLKGGANGAERMSTGTALRLCLLTQWSAVCSDVGCVDKIDTQRYNKETNCEPNEVGRSWKGGARERADDVFFAAGIKRRRSKADFAPTWCRWRGSNPHALARDFKSLVSANSTTPACAYVITGGAACQAARKLLISGPSVGIIY